MTTLRTFFSLVKLCTCCSGIFILSGCYYLQQGSKLLHYQCSAELNKNIIADSSTPQDIRKFLITVEDIRRYAVEKVGLKKNTNFSCFVKTDRDYLIDNVYAASADTFVQYFWHYPFIGAMPYKGFFNRDDAETEAGKLRKKGYDVFVGAINGFSTLGVLRDPVYSFMTNYGPYSLSNLLFHELTHATVFVKNQSQFNEESATFVGTEAGLRYVADRYGTGSEAHEKAQLLIEDTRTYQRLMADLYRQLDSVYRSEKSRQIRIASKNRIINDFKLNIAKNYCSLFKTKSYNNIIYATINNATILISMTYTRDLDDYYTLLKRYGGDLKKTVAALCELQKMEGDPKINLRAMIMSPLLDK